MHIMLLKQILLLGLSISPLFYLVYRISNKKLGDLITFICLIFIYILIYRRFIFGSQFVFHDTMWCHHIFYSIIDQWIQNGFSIGWNPFMNGGEPLFIYSNYFLWAEFVLFSIINKIFSIPVHQLINLYFTYIFISYFVFCFIVFSVIFKRSSIVFFPTAVLIFSGITLSSFGQYMLSPLYLLPLVFLALTLFVQKKEKIYLAWLFFFLCVSANHYFPHYLLIFIFVFFISWYLFYFIYYRKESSFPYKKLNIRYIVFVLLISVIVLLPALDSYIEIKNDYISPTRGNASLSKKLQGFQPSVGLPWQNYQFLISIPPVNPNDSSAGNLMYNHSVYFLGFIAILFFFISFFYNKGLFYRSCVASLIIIMYVALSSETLLWRLAKEYIPMFYLRHSYVFSQIICFLIIIISTFGFCRVIKTTKFRYGIIFLTSLLSIYPCTKLANYINGQPYILEPFVYPKTRSFYSPGIIPVPFDTAPLILKRAAATHYSDNFLAFRKRAFYDLLNKNPDLVVGSIFLFLEKDLNGNLKDLKEIPITYIIDNDPNHVKIKADIPTDGYLIRKENFHKDWKAKVNDVEIPILKFENTFQVIKIQKGEAVIDFIFSSSYNTHFWLHVIFVLIGYIFFFRDLIKSVSLNELSEAECV